jgi:Tol biopolymer transport system component
MVTAGMKRILLPSLIVCLCFVHCDPKGLDKKAVLSGPFLGQVPPGTSPVLFAPNTVSTGMFELNNVWTPDGSEFFFSVSMSGGRGVSMMRMALEDNRWTEPALLPFASRYGDIDMSVSPDGSMLFFCSRRPLRRGGEPRGDYDFWVSARTPDGWDQPRHLGPDVNSDFHDYYPVLTNLGFLYFSSQREGEGTNNIYRSRYTEGRFEPAEKLGAAINSEYREFDPYAAPDESFLIFTSERSGGFGRGDLYISFKQEDGTWAPAVNMGDRVNTEHADFCPMLTPDGEYLFLTSTRVSSTDPPDHALEHSDLLQRYNQPQNGSGDIYWMNAGIISELRSESR